MRDQGKGDKKGEQNEESRRKQMKAPKPANTKQKGTKARVDTDT